MEIKKNKYQPPDNGAYSFAGLLSGILTRFIFKPKIIRNETADVKGSYVLLCNHECAFDAVASIRSTSRKQTFVLSKAFYETVPMHNTLSKLHPIVKQQFQTKLSDIRKMKAVIDAGEPLVLYPAGLMTENGCSTPIPEGTYQFLLFLNTDVYVGRIRGSYFVMPKWSNKLRPGKTTFETYKLIDREELNSLSLEEIKKKVDDALYFDAYAEQETLMIKYRGGKDIRGLEKVLYRCPHCGTENTINAVKKNTLQCTACGYTATADDYGFLHTDSKYREIRHPSQWDLENREALKAEVMKDPENYCVTAAVEIHMIDVKKHRFCAVGEGVLTLDYQGFELKGVIKSAPVVLSLNLDNIPILPSSPIRNCIELQIGDDIYRCIIKDYRKSVIKWIHLIKIFYDYNKKQDSGFRESKGKG